MAGRDDLSVWHPRRKRASLNGRYSAAIYGIRSGQNFPDAPTTRREASCFVSRKCRELEWSDKNGGRSRIRELSSRERRELETGIKTDAISV